MVVICYVSIAARLKMCLLVARGMKTHILCNDSCSTIKDDLYSTAVITSSSCTFSFNVVCLANHCIIKSDIMFS